MIQTGRRGFGSVLVYRATRLAASRGSSAHRVGALVVYRLGRDVRHGVAPERRDAAIHLIHAPQLFQVHSTSGITDRTWHRHVVARITPSWICTEHGSCVRPLHMSSRASASSALVNVMVLLAFPDRSARSRSRSRLDGRLSLVSRDRRQRTTVLRQASSCRCLIRISVTTSPTVFRTLFASAALEGDDLIGSGIDLTHDVPAHSHRNLLWANRVYRVRHIDEW